MLKHILIIFIINFILTLNSFAEIKWPKFMTKEIPAKTLDKINLGSNDEIKSILNQIDLNNKQMRIVLMKTIVQTEYSKILMGSSQLDPNEQQILESLLKKYVPE